MCDLLEDRAKGSVPMDALGSQPPLTIPLPPLPPFNPLALANLKKMKKEKEVVEEAELFP